MAKVLKPAYEWTGEHRPPRTWEFFMPNYDRKWGLACSATMFPDNESRDIYREVMREHEVPDPVPEWIDRLYDERGTWWKGSEGFKALCAAYRAHVAERAKAAAERIYLDASLIASDRERIIREEFLK